MRYLNQQQQVPPEQFELDGNPILELDEIHNSNQTAHEVDRHPVILSDIQPSSEQASGAPRESDIISKWYQRIKVLSRRLNDGLVKANTRGPMRVFLSARQLQEERRERTIVTF